MIDGGLIVLVLCVLFMVLIGVTLLRHVEKSMFSPSACRTNATTCNGVRR